MRDNKLELTVNRKEKSLVIAAAKAEGKSMATFMRDAIINKSQKAIKK